MMWNNAGSFLAPRCADNHADSSSESEDSFDNLVTTPVATPLEIDIARRDPFWGVESVYDESSFFAKKAQRAARQAPRCIHEVHTYMILLEASN